MRWVDAIMFQLNFEIINVVVMNFWGSFYSILWGGKISYTKLKMWFWRCISKRIKWVSSQIKTKNYFGDVYLDIFNKYINIWAIRWIFWRCIYWGLRRNFEFFVTFTCHIFSEMYFWNKRIKNIHPRDHRLILVFHSKSFTKTISFSIHIFTPNLHYCV